MLWVCCGISVVAVDDLVVADGIGLENSLGNADSVLTLVVGIDAPGWGKLWKELEGLKWLGTEFGADELYDEDTTLGVLWKGVNELTTSECLKCWEVEGCWILILEDLLGKLKLVVGSWLKDDENDEDGLWWFVDDFKNEFLKLAVFGFG